MIGKKALTILTCVFLDLLVKVGMNMGHAHLQPIVTNVNQSHLDYTIKPLHGFLWIT